MVDPRSSEAEGGGTMASIAILVELQRDAMHYMMLIESLFSAENLQLQQLLRGT
ncbi:hypothetical protein CK203_016054 [Vitis vinifera]|uniref:Uncharacterized protein n=1 Tax=Vitis vinifera TaxID=29760 RepID=A0A438JN71_VITVI|nr:hypothetical protein CK203_016054 [Vitis vinifera]